MHKQGFTLAEILITLTIIGVVAALAAPALVVSSQNAKIGPTLQKAVSTFENAAQLLLNEEESTMLTSIAPHVPNDYDSGVKGGAKIGLALSHYMKLTQDKELNISYAHYNSNVFAQGHYQGENTFVDNQNVVYYIKRDWQPGTPGTNDYADVPSNQVIGTVDIDINGAQKPNRIGKDLFRFVMYNDGTLRPWGQSGYHRHYSYSGTPEWKIEGSKCDSTGVQGDGWTCTGSIFDNNMKVIYK